MSDWEFISGDCESDKYGCHRGMVIYISFTADRRQVIGVLIRLASESVDIYREKIQGSIS